MNATVDFTQFGVMAECLQLCRQRLFGIAFQLGSTVAAAVIRLPQSFLHRLLPLQGIGRQHARDMVDDIRPPAEPNAMTGFRAPALSSATSNCVAACPARPSSAPARRRRTAQKAKSLSWLLSRNPRTISRLPNASSIELVRRDDIALLVDNAHMRGGGALRLRIGECRSLSVKRHGCPAAALPMLRSRCSRLLR